MHIAYENWEPRADLRRVIEQVEAICADYARRGYNLTLRQVYYQFVARDLFPADRRWTWNENSRRWVKDIDGTPNAEPNYNWLGELINRGRLAGMISWNHIIDRTRNASSRYHWRGPEEIIRNSADAYHIDLWHGQPQRVEVWVEKDALEGIVSSAASGLDVLSFSCRGYTSQSEMWSAGRRIGRHIAKGHAVTILHLGDHDPSGVDMTRDIEDRLRRFIYQDWFNDHPGGPKLFVDMEREMQRGMLDGTLPAFQVRRIALNMDQVEQYDPPPNPAKLTDARAKGYIERYGDESWELDALDPDVLTTLVETEIGEHLDRDMYDDRETELEREQARIRRFADRWSELAGDLDTEE